MALIQLPSYFFVPFSGEIIQDSVAIDYLGGQQLLKGYGFREVMHVEGAVVYELREEEFSQLFKRFDTG